MSVDTKNQSQSPKTKMNAELIHDWAGILNAARMNTKPIPQLTQSFEITRDQAYEMQERQLALRIAKGEKLVGWKMGLTSEAKRKQMNLDSSLYGFLTDLMQVKAGTEFNIASQIHCKIEPEIAFLIGKDLPSSPTRAQVLESLFGAAPALEILDSRYTEFKYFTMEDVIADNSSSSHFLVGPWEKRINQIDFKNLNLKMKVDGQVKQSGRTDAISGDPLQSVIELCQLLSKRDKKLKSGMIVLAGAATAAEALTAGQTVSLEMDSMPSIEVKIKNDPKSVRK